MKANRPKKSWNLMSRVIWPSIYFVSGVLFSAVLLGGLHDPVESSTAAPGLQTRVVELMGRVNDLEGTVGDLEHQLKGAETQHLLCLGDLQNTKMEVSKADKAADKARQLAAAGKAGGACPPCASGCASGCASAGGDEGAEPDWASSPAKDWASETEEEAKWGREVAAKGDKGGGQAAVKWSPVGRKWQATELEPVSFMNKFDIGLPIETIKWSGGQLLVPSPKRGRLEETGTALDHIDHDCNELDVMVLNDQHCVAVTHVNGAAAGHSTPYHINRFLKGGYKAKKWGKKSAVPEGEWEFVSRLTSKSGSNEGAPPGDGSIKTHRKALNRFLTSVDDVESKLRPILAKAAKARGDNTVMTMTMNAGMTDLVLNFVCSAKRAGHSIDHLVLFPTDQEAVEVAKSLGVAHFSHPSFGDFPKEEARSYGDNTFVKMMWIKVLCVYLPIDLGFNVLFQDADVVWLRDPIQEYFLDPKVAGDFDVYFQVRFSGARVFLLCQSKPPRFEASIRGSRYSTEIRHLLLQNLHSTHTPTQSTSSLPPSFALSLDKQLPCKCRLFCITHARKTAVKNVHGVRDPRTPAPQHPSTPAPGVCAPFWRVAG